jgi:hypothetical protein
MWPEPCDTTEPDTIPVLAGGWLDLIHQQIADSDLARIETVDLVGEWL